VKKVLKLTLVTQWFPPEPVELWKELALELQSQGYEVTVVTAFPNYPYGKIYSGYRQGLFHTEYMGGVKVIRLPVFPNHSNSVVMRGLSYVSFALSLLVIGSFRLPKSDVILCYSPPLTVAIVTALIAKVRKNRFIVNIQDMWPDTLVASGVIAKESKIINLIEFFAKRVYRRAAAIVVLSEGFKEHLDKKYNIGKKVFYIPNLTHQLITAPKELSLDAKKSLGISEDEFIFLYAGNIGAAQGIDVMLDAAEQLDVQYKVRLVLLGDGVLVEELKQAVNERNLSNKVVFAGRVASKEVSVYYEMADALILHLRPDDLFKITIPHKIISYLESGKAIVSVVSGEVNQIVKKANAGVTCESGNSEGMSKSMEAIMNLPCEERLEMGRNGKLFYQENFSRRFIRESWNRLIKNLK